MNNTTRHVKFNFSEITDNIYLGTNLCCIILAHTQVLKNKGINADINLENERQEEFPDVEIYLWLPVKDKTAPSQFQLEVGAKAIDSIVNSEKKVYVHCKNGHSRSPTLVAAYFILKGMNPEDAIAKIKSKRPEIHLLDVQKDALRKYYNEKT